LLIHAEQGQGDTLQFSRYATLVAQRGGRVILQVQSRVHRLLKDLPGVAQCIRQGDDVPDFSVCAALMSLFFLYGATPETIPPPATLSPLKAVAPTASNHLRVGIAWAGSPAHVKDRSRSTRLAQWAPLAEVAGVVFSSLQGGEAASQTDEASNPFEFVGDSRGDTDFADTAESIAQLDLVVTVDTSIAHLAGSMGKPVWILLDKFSDWRWGLGAEKTPWYPTARLFRQSHAGEWKSVLIEVKSNLQQIASAYSARVR